MKSFEINPTLWFSLFLQIVIFQKCWKNVEHQNKFWKKSHLYTIYSEENKSLMEQQTDILQQRNGRLICPICDLKFKKYTFLKSHMRLIHTGQKLFTCTICEKKFALKIFLERHLTKGQLISKYPFGVFKSPEKSTKIL